MAEAPHDRRSQRAARACGEDPGALLPAVHRVVSLAKRWLLGTHQGSMEPAHVGQLPERVRVPLQPPALPQPRHGLLPRARTRRAPRPGTLPGPNRHQPAPGRATHAAVWARAPAELGTPSSELPLENRGVKLVRLNGYPQRWIICRQRQRLVRVFHGEDIRRIVSTPH